MMNKYVCFPTFDSDTVNAEVLDVTRRGAGGLDKLAGYTPPSIAAFLATLRPDPRYQFVLMTPMGSSEFWGSNSNGDYWPDQSLSFDRDRDAASKDAVVKALVAKFLTPFGKQLPAGDYSRFGHRSFEDADRFMNHVNKDPSLSYGRIPVAAWNPEMHRVEVIVRHDREAAKRVGAEQVIIDIDEHRPRLISMGARLKFDVCNICGNCAANTTLYCQHLRYSMGKFLADGRQVYAINMFPNFFDLSDVGVPAAKESAVLAKVASENRVVPEIRTSTLALRRIPGAEKTADVVKRVLGGSTELPRLLGAGEPVLNSATRSLPLPEMISATAPLGIVLKPEEFQDGWLRSRGMAALAAALRAAAQVFDPEPPCDLSPLPLPSDMLRKLLPPLDALTALRADVPARSALSPFVEPRIMAIHISKVAHEVPAPNALPPAVHEAFFEQINADYAAYRAMLSGNVWELVKQAAEAYPEFYAGLAPADAHLFKMAQRQRGTTNLTAGYISSVYGGAPEVDLRPISNTGFVS